MEIVKYRTWIEISKQAVAHNNKIFRALIGKKVKLLGVIKSNAYGHGLMTIARALAALKVDFLGVDSIAEANKLRKEKIKLPILVLGYTQPENLPIAAAKKIILTVSSFEALNDVSKLNKNISIHLKIDTGMHRQGFFISDINQVLQLLKSSPKINVAGLYTHFAAAKKPDSNHETEKQIAEFKKAVTMIRKIYPKAVAHAAATAGTLVYPESHFDIVRVGIGMYGLWPSDEIKKYLGRRLNLRPILTWKAILSEIKTLEKGAKIGYDYTESVRRTSKVAILPIGYWHGFWRAFSSKAYVLIGGQRCKILGRVSMDMISVDVTNVPKVKVGDEAVLIGKQGREEITADGLAKIAGTSNYEIVTRLNPLIKKFYM